MAYQELDEKRNLQGATEEKLFFTYFQNRQCDRTIVVLGINLISILVDSG